MTRTGSMTPEAERAHETQGETGCVFVYFIVKAKASGPKRTVSRPLTHSACACACVSDSYSHSYRYIYFSRRIVRGALNFGKLNQLAQGDARCVYLSDTLNLGLVEQPATVAEPQAVPSVSSPI